MELKKELLTSKSLKGEIFLENHNKKLKYFVLYDDIKLTEKIRSSGGVMIDREAYAQKLEGIASEDKIILTG